MKSGSPEDKSRYQSLIDGDIIVWAPNSLKYADDTVQIDLEGFLWMVNLVVTSASPSPSPASGGCDSCSGCN